MKLIYENIATDCSLNLMSITSDKFDFYWHFHSEYEITLITRGYGKRFVSNCVEEFYSQDLVLLGKNIPHTWKSEDIDCKKVSATVIQFSDSVLKALLKFPEFLKIKEFIANASFGIKIDVNNHIIKKIKQLEKTESELRIIYFFELLLILSSQKFQRILNNPYDTEAINTNHRITFVLDYVHHHYQNSCRIEDVAKLIHITKSGFAKFFRNSTGVCFSHYLNQLRIKEASKLLIETDKSIKEIYSLVGFENQAYFNRTFKRITLFSPKEFRMKQWNFLK